MTMKVSNENVQMRYTEIRDGKAKTVDKNGGSFVRRYRCRYTPPIIAQLLAFEIYFFSASTDFKSEHTVDDAS